MYDPGLAILLLWHIGSIVVWLGAALTFSFALSNPMRSIDPDARKRLFCAFFPKLSKMLGAASASAILAGGILYGYLTSVDTAHVPNSLGFIFITIGALLGLISAIMTLGAILPQGSKFVKIATGDPTYVKDPETKEGTPDEESMLRGIDSSLKAVAVILGIAMIVMVLGTNL